MKDLTIWITYHDDKQIEEYKLEEDNTFRLFKGNDLNVVGYHINHLNQFYSEITTLYWVWKNQIRSEVIGFCHYRRIFTHIMDVQPGVCQVLQIADMADTVNQYYKIFHNYNDLYDIIEILDKKYRKGNEYSKYLLESTIFIPYCSFIMHYEDFEKLCDFLFPILLAFDTKNGLNMSADNYRRKAEKDFRYDNVDYQQRAISFIAERVISAYLVNHMELLSVQNHIFKKK